MSDDRTVTVEVGQEFVDGKWPDAVEFEVVQTGDSRVFEFYAEDSDE